MRQILWPALLARVPQILPYAPHTEDGILARLERRIHASKIFLSADLTCATDGFGHDAILAVIAGIRKAGFPAHLIPELQESLGVGHNCHFVKYRLSDMDHETEVWCRRTFDVVDGCVEVPKNRGSLMGTPCSFSILSLLNHWMSELLGPDRIICGDDLAAVTHPSNVSSYSQRASAVGSGLHERKSFRSSIGFVFCEAYALLDQRGAVVSFRPPSLKEFVRKGNGVMCQDGVDSSSFNRLARCARTIYKKQRLVAAKKHRPAELPSWLGGLGHPCKGRLRVPLWCREALKELYLCESPDHGGPHNPQKFVRVLSVPAVPTSRSEHKKSAARVEDWLAEKLIVDPQPGDDFLTNKELGTYSAVCTNLSYLATGQRFRKTRPQDVSVGKVSWPKPSGPSCRGGFLSTRCRIRTIREWDRRARCELGTYFPADFSAHIRGRIAAYRKIKLPGDDR